MQQPTTSNRLRPFRPTPFGRYTLLMPLSMGGMGEIFLARIDGPQGFEKLCVIKKILPHLAEDKDFVSRFGNEARTLVKLTHGSIAQVLDMGQHNGEPYLALEYIDGKDLRKVGARFRERGMPLPMTFVLFVMGRVLDALAYAHRKRDDDDKEIGLVHRDMSPQNILISYEGEVKVIDFGLAKSTLNASKTNPSIILGKFLYMSPEQARHAKVDKRSDLYAVGICLYELIAGKNPFEDIPPHALMAAVASPNIAHVQTVEPLCPSNIASIIMKALAVDPAQRFQTAEELRGKLLGALLEIDPAAGPESCSRFMRDMFAAEYQAERKLLAQLKEAARVEVKPETTEVGPPRPAAQVRPLQVARTSSPRVEPPKADESTPAPTDLRKYGMEPTIPRAMPLALDTSPLSFAPTPKVSGIQADKSNEGDRETAPGVIIQRPTGADDDRETSPHLALTGGAAPAPPDLNEDAPTRPVPVQSAKATPFGALPPVKESSATTAPAMEPVTSEAPVVAGPSDENLPSVMVSGLQSQSLAPATAGRVTTGKSAPVRAQVTGVLVPASSVRTPEVVAPLPKALEGRHRPDENLQTDRGTRSRRTSMAVVVVPLFAFLALASFVGYSILKEQHETELDEAASTSPLKSSFDDQKRRTLRGNAEYADDVDPPAPGKPQEPTALQPPPEPVVEDPLPEKLPAPAPPPQPVVKAPAKPLPKTRAGRELRAVRLMFDKAERTHVLEQFQENSLRQKLEVLEHRVYDLKPAQEAKFLNELQEIRAALEKAR